MVFFSCNACGESLKKANVEKHYLTKCRACEVLSCLDCGKDFYGDGYKEHTSCISEDQKYGGKNFKATPHKGAVKQNSWIEVVRGASMSPSLNPKVRNTFKTIINCGQDNIPRKKAKFMNFVKNSVHVRESWVIEQVWNTIETYSAAQKKESDQSTIPQDGDANGNIQTTEKTRTGGEELERMKQGIEEKTSIDDSNRDKRNMSDRKRKRQGDPLEEAGGDGEKASKEQQPKKKKKKKKRKDDGENEVELNYGDEDDGLDKPSKSLMGDLDKSEQSIQNGNSEPSGAQEEHKKRKKKKHKREVNSEPLKTLGVGHNQSERRPRQEDVTDSQNEMSRSDQRKKGKKQRKKKEEKENGFEEDAEDEGDDDVAAGDEVIPPNKGGKFRWEDVITQVLQNAGGEIRLKKLKKKVFSEYFAQGGDGSITSEEKLFIKFNKKVMKNPKFKVHKEMVQLKH